MKGYKQNKETIFGRLGNEMVMMDIQQGKYFSLNPVATHVWDLLEMPSSLDTLCNKLMEEYEIDAEQCHVDVQEYLDEMEKLRLVLQVDL